MHDQPSDPFDTQPVEPVSPPAELDFSASSFENNEIPPANEGSATPLFANPMYVEDEIGPAEPSFGRKMVHALKDVLETIVPAVIIALLINLFLAQATRVYGQSMEPSLHTDQRLVVEKVSYKLHTPKRGDVVVLKIRDDSEELLIKRVIGLPGETIEIRDGRVFVDEVEIAEPYLAQPTRGHYGPLVVPPETVFVLGDNRGASNDSRSFGPVEMHNIVGRAWVSYWPLEDVGLIE